MKPRRLLYLSAHQMTAFVWRSGEVMSEGAYSATADGHQQFAAYLAQYPSSVFSLLVNVSEEGFHVESIPFLRGADRKLVIERKLGQLFFNRALTTSLSLGYEKSKRKDERVLLAALNDAESFSPWLAAIKGAGVSLSGIFSLPLLGPSLLAKLKVGEPRCLLLTVQYQSIRQSYIEAGHVHFSRLTPLHDSSASGIAHAFAAETRKLRQYLASQRLLGRNESIAAFVLTHAQALAAVRTSCVDSETIHYEILAIEDCAQRTGLKTVPTTGYCEAIFLNLLVAGPPQIQFANDDQRHDFHLAQIRSALFGIGAFVLTGCLIFSANLLFQSHMVRTAADTLASEASQSRQRYNDIVRTFPPIPTTNETLRRVVDRYSGLGRGSPDRLYRELSVGVQATPEAELESIDWQAGIVEAAAPATGQNPPARSGVASETIVVRGTLRMAANPRQTLAAFDRFLAALTTNPNLRVEVIKRPFDIESGKSLKSGDASPEDTQPRAFSVRVAGKFAS